MTTLTSQQALDKLLSGNSRFVSGKLTPHDFKERRGELVNTQQPIATVICCSDSRAPPEFIFDCTLGEIFVIRTAGGVMGTREFGSIEYAVTHLKTPLVVVMSHTKCGACTAACTRQDAEKCTTCLDKLVDDLSSIAKECHKEIPATCIKSAFAHAASVENDKTLVPLIEEGKCVIVPMLYDIDTGVASVLKDGGLGKHLLPED
ncbi:carbonic anhydrase, putative [Entamoeba invadens IP1]|uniref:Carbonic anhydrase n=1 Tax=Entamoeba invadens IP1 TaxID=370355 RepID=A0A0A1TXM4_ENTIV|nr:carbonic anhydrase, putative [Entamoeba invadens IP1]ELP84280.1 carbonic anhydrase, putative [Entamoeba invadens IP1]|eukprot:XP_004183626.1 carbonic anhydrase, putative [Entamoeba invadens IP1]